MASELEVIYNKGAENGADSPRNNNEIIKIPFTDKSLDIKNSSSYLITGLIAFIDGFNPCSLWVLTFMLGFIIYSGSRKRILLVDFLLTTAIVYGFFISKLSLKQGQRLKLIGGIVMLALGLSYMIDYSFMQNYLNLLYLFGFSLLLSLVIIVLDSKLFKR